MSNTTEDARYTSPLKRALKAITDLSAKLDTIERSATEPIAVIGVGCRFPRGVDSPEDLRNMLIDGCDGITDIPTDRWDVDAYYDPDPEAVGKMYTRRGGMLTAIDQFEPQFFGISPREAIEMDPQQRLLLETSWEALERAGQDPHKLVGSQTGVFIGIGSSDYANLGGQNMDPARIDAYSGTGVAMSVASGRISYVLGLQGPTLTVDTACSSSLVAVHIACQSLRAKKCRMALAGGANLILSPQTNIYLSRVRAIAPDGRCKTFDAGADGYGRGEGCAVIVLKRLSDALADRSPILALIKGSAINHDGRTSGLTVPSGRAQQAVIREALKDAGIEPRRVGYVEAHGTGTPLGDPIELEALAAVFLEERDTDHPLLVGSIKTNLGHLEAAAGIAGLIKVILALQHQEIPPHLNFSTPTPRFDWKANPIRVPTERTPWLVEEGSRLAGVSSFGFSGTNAHLIVQEAAAAENRTDGTGSAKMERPLHLITLSARNADALQKAVDRLAQHLNQGGAGCLADLGYTANFGRSHFSHRLALVCENIPQLQEMLLARQAGKRRAGTVDGVVDNRDQKKIALLFTGQGSQYVGMGRRLYETQPTFRKTLERCDEILRSELERPLLSVLYPEPGRAQEAQQLLDQTGYAQPALFALEYALAELWRSWGIEPAAVMGHSVGEYVAACVAGVFSMEDGLRLIAARGRLMQSLPQGGAMAALFTDEQTALGAIAPHAGTVSLAALNGPTNTVISGAASAVEAIRQGLQQRGIDSVPLNVSHAFHSPLMEPMLDEFERRAEEIDYVTPRVSLILNVDGRSAGADSIGPLYWRRHARSPVRFQESLQTLAGQGFLTFLEIGPKAVLTGMGRRCIAPEIVTWFASLNENGDDWHEMLQSLAQLYVHGIDVDWAAFDGDYSRRIVTLPTYPFQRQRYWLTPGSGTSLAANDSAARIAGKHNLPGLRIRTALKERVFELRLSETTPIALEDHCIYERIVVPGAFHITWILSAAEAALAAPPLALMDVSFPQAVTFEAGEHRTAQAILKPLGEQEAAFEIFSQNPANEADQEWMMHASGKIVHGQGFPGDTGPQPFAIEEIRSRCQRTAYASFLYTRAREMGLTLGPSFQCIGDVWRNEGEALALLKQPASHSASQVQLTAGMVDSCFQLIGAALPTSAVTESIYVPVGFRQFQYFGCPAATLWCHVALQHGDWSNQEVITADIAIVTDNGTVVARIEDLTLKRAPRESMLRTTIGSEHDWVYRIEWRPEPAERVSEQFRGKPDTPRVWLIFTDMNGLAESLARRLEADGRTSLLVDHGEDYTFNPRGRSRINPNRPEDFTRLLQDTVGRHSKELLGIVHLWDADHLWEDPSIDELDRAQRLGCGAILHLLQALSAIEPACSARLWIVTRGTQAAGSPTAAPRLTQAALWGLGRVISLEQPEVWGGLLDLEPVANENEVKHLFEAVYGQPRMEKALVLRDGRWLVPRLRRCPMPGGSALLKVTAESTYLITGGLGALGIEIARWMTEKGARHLVLVGRTAPSASAATALEHLEKSGAEIMVFQADVAREREMEALFEEIRETLPPLKGIVHAAGIIDDGLLCQLEWSRFARVLEPKIAGAWNLHRLSAALPLDFFVLFSSVAAVLGNSGQGSYAAANAFLDSLAHYRRSRGLPAISVNWGAWGEVGMAARTFGADLGALNKKGVGSITPREGLAILEMLVSGDTRFAPISPAQAIVVPVRWDRFQSSLPTELKQTLLAELLDGASSKPIDEPELDRHALSTMEPSQRQSAAESYLAARISKILMIPLNQIEKYIPLTRMGFDSMMALQIKNQITSQFEVAIPIAQFLDGPSIAQLAGRLATAVVECCSSGAPTSSNNSVTLAVQWEEGEI